MIDNVEVYSSSIILMKIITNNTLQKLYRFLCNCEDFVFLDTSKPDKKNRQSLLFINPVMQLQFREGEDEVQFLQIVQEKQRAGYYIAGWFSYEFGYLFEPSLKKRLSRKDDKNVLMADLGVFQKCYYYNHETGESDFPLPDGNEILAGDSYSVKNLTVSQSEAEYKRALQKVLQYIEAGDTYQVNYTLKMLFDFHGSPEMFYNDLRRNQSVCYGAYIRRKERRVMSFSPELFFWKSDAEVMVRPMKGTVKRGKTATEDANQRQFLKTDIKNQSENVMIVDLLRNDLGRLMHLLTEGDVQVDSLFDVETFETLLQMTSTISGKTSKEALAAVPLHTFFKTIFPCGSVTGAPKIRTMEIIDELETGRRGVYTGAIGYMAPTGEAVFNVPIRTVTMEGSEGEMGIGSGIVHDSDPAQEWQECLLKGKFLTAPVTQFSLFETLLWVPESGYVYVDQHLERLRCSAEYFLFTCETEEIRKRLQHFSKQFSDMPQRVRLVLEKDGTCQIETSECDPPSILYLPPQPNGKQQDRLPFIRLSSQPVDSSSCWLYHKTTRRKLYTAEYAAAVEGGFADTVFVNENDAVTEGCISNLVVFVDGRYCTPPVTDGLLAGVMRQQLLDNASVSIEERSLTREDLVRAEAIFLCNSVRGVRQVRL